MSLLDRLASSLNRRDEAPNTGLAKQIADTEERKAVQEMVAHLQNKNKSIQSDCIKVLYETGERNPLLIAPHANVFLSLLRHKNNRLQWGAMMALHSMTTDIPEEIYAALPKILDAADKGSVITKDYAVNILIKLCSMKRYADEVFILLTEQLASCPANQLAMYAERSISVVNDRKRQRFIQTLTVRLAGIDQEAKRKRIEKAVKKVSGR